MIASDLVFFNSKCLIRKFEFDHIDSPQKLRLESVKKSPVAPAHLLN